MKNKENIINYEVMGGWPIYKMNIRDIIQELGAKFNEKTNKWEIEETSALDIFPVKLNDDGMGYGVNEEYIIEVSMFNDKDNQYCSIFTEKELDHLNIWKKHKIYPAMSFTYDNEEYYYEKLEEVDGKYYFICRHAEDFKKVVKIAEDQLSEK